MREYTKEKQDMYVKKLLSCTCDVCKKDYIDDNFEFQEMIHIHNTGGYGSIFGDGDKVDIDICQHCLKDIIDKFDIKGYLNRYEDTNETF